MQPFPHRYGAVARATLDGDATIGAAGVADLLTGPPPEFGGAGGRWTPETLVVAAAADCLVLTFRAMAGVSKLPWRSLDCEAEGTLDRVDGVVRFTGLKLRASLVVPDAASVDRARRLLEKAERGCLVTRSLAFEAELEAQVTAAP